MCTALVIVTRGAEKHTRCASAGALRLLRANKGSRESTPITNIGSVASIDGPGICRARRDRRACADRALLPTFNQRGNRCPGIENADQRAYVRLRDRRRHGAMGGMAAGFAPVSREPH